MLGGIHQYYVYLLTYKGNTVLYTGVTTDPKRRIWEHKQKIFPGFSATYNCNKLVWFEEFNWVQDAIDREKQLKAGSRNKKVRLIVEENPEWHDLSVDWYA